MTTGNQSLHRVVLPIRLGIDPMERLLVANFKDDPEFEWLEPQVFDDPINGRGMRVLRYRKHGKVEVYWQPGVRVDKSTFAVGAGIGDFAETTIDPSHFEITPSSLDLHVAFTDVQGRRVELHVHEDTHDKRGFPLLAPVGADVENPPKLMLVFMPSIDLVRRSGSLVEGRIGDRTLPPASLPILLNWQSVWFVRYVSRPVIPTLNPPMSRPVLVELLAPGSVEVEGMTVVVDGDGSVTRISTGREPSRVENDFVSITGGSYSASCESDRVSVELDVTEQYKPSGLPLSMDIFTQLVRSFLTFPTTYKWHGVVELGAEPIMSGTWERK